MSKVATDFLNVVFAAAPDKTERKALGATTSWDDWKMPAGAADNPVAAAQVAGRTGE